MNTIKIYLAESGRIADLRKDFPLYQGQYQNKLLNIYVPTSILAPNFSEQESGTTIAEYVSSTAVKIGMQTVERDGKIYTSKTYYMRYLKTLTYQNVEYALYERKLPREFTFYSGQGLNAPNLIANVVNIDNSTTPATILEITTSQTCSLDVMPSTYLDRDEPIEASGVEEINGRLNEIDEILTEKQNKNDQSLVTTSKNIVGAINENKRRIDTNVAEIGENSQDIAQNRNDISELKEIVGTGQDYIGTMTVNSLPSTSQLNGFVQSQKGRSPKGGDTIIVVYRISGETDKSFKYIYNGDTWTSYEIPPVEEASNGTKGLVEGTYGIADYNTLVDIVGGRIINIYIKNNNGAYQTIHSYINMNSQDIEDIINGDTVVGEAMKAIEDGMGNNIANTYLTQLLGATKQFVRDYAQPREFGNVYFISATGYKTQVPTTPPSGIQFSTATNAIGSFRIFQLEKTNEASFELSSTNGYSNTLQISANQNCQVQFRLITEYQKGSGNWVNLSTELSNTTSLISDDITKIQLSSQFLSIGDSVLMLDVGDKIRQTLEVVTQTSSAITFSLYSNDTFPSTFSITSQSYILSDIDQAKSQIIMIGADGVVEGGNVVMTVQNAENYIEYRTNQREFLLNGNVPVVGEIPSTYPIRITFGETVYNLYSFMKGGSSPLTFGDIASSTTYNTNTGYDFNIRVMFIQTSDISGFVLSPSTMTADQIVNLIGDDGSVNATVGADGKVMLVLDTTLQNKLMKALITPMTAPAGFELVGIDNTNSQAMVDLGEDFKVENDTLKLTGENISNPNLLLNGDFRVNQRGQTTYTENNKYTVDRWLFRGNGSLTQLENSIIITAGQNDTLTGIFQNFELSDYSKFMGKTLTMSIKISDLTISQSIFRIVLSYSSAGGTAVGTILKSLDVTRAGTFKATINIPTDIPTSGTTFKMGLYFQNPLSTDNAIIEWAKLEVGSVATEFSPRPYAEELAMCERYYQKIKGLKRAVSTYSFYDGFNAMRVPMRTTPTISVYALNNSQEISSNSNTMFDIVTNTEIVVTISTAYPSALGFKTQCGNSAFTQNNEYQYLVICDAEIY